MFRYTICLAVLMGLLISDDPATGRGPADPPGAGRRGVFDADLPRIKPKYQFGLPGKSVNERSVTLSNNGQRLAVIIREGLVARFAQVWDLAGEPRVVAEIKNGGSPDGPVFSPSGKLLALSDYPGVYDIASKKRIAKLPYTFTHAFFKDENTVVTARRTFDITTRRKGRVTVWDVTKDADAGSFDVPDDRFCDVFPIKDGTQIGLVMTAKKFEVECYDLASKQLVHTIRPEPEPPGRPFTSSGMWPAITPDGTVFTGHAISKQTFYDAKTGKILGSLPPNLSGTATGFLRGGAVYLAKLTRTVNEKPDPELTALVLYDWKAQKPVAALTGTPDRSGYPGPLAAVSGDGMTVVNVTVDGEVLVFDISSLK